MKRASRTFLIFLLISITAAPQGFAPGEEVYRALASISVKSLRGNLSFVASNLLEGRETPSRGLDIAAEFIASQFRKAGLEPAGDDGYFQTAQMIRAVPPPADSVLRLQEGSQTVTISNDEVTVITRRPVEVRDVPVYPARSAAELQVGDVKGRAVVLDEPAEGAHPLAKAAAALDPAVFIDLSDDEIPASLNRLIDPDEERATFGDVPRLIVRDPAAVKLLRKARGRESGLTLSIHLAPSTTAPVTVRNVVGWLRGSDAALRDRYVLLTAHYDHIGRNRAGAINPGANDDGSGTVSVIEIAQALAALAVHPKRSIVFMTFFGEEAGSLGARYYTWHPLFPLSKTIADLNLEQVGRTDSTAGRKRANATLTGFRYSNVTRTLQAAGELTGIKVYETPNDGEYYSRSDNLPFAERGVPSHTIAVAFDFPGYHSPEDVWQKIDYNNMAKVDRMIALATIMLANNAEAPQWNRNNPNVTGYLPSR